MPAWYESNYGKKNMPAVNWELREVQKNITRPVVDTVVRNYFELLGLGGSEIEVRHKGDAEAISVPGSTIDKKGHIVRLSTDEFLDVEYEEEYDENAVRSTPITRIESPFIFKDPTTGLMVCPVRQELKSTITLRINCADKQRVGILLRKYKTLISRDVDQLSHKLSYSYDVPPPILSCLIDIYKLRENIAGYMDSFDDWFNNNFVPNKVTAYTFDGKNPVCKIAESSVRAVTFFEGGDEVPKKEKNDDAGGWYAEIRLGFYWQRVESMTIYYPIMVHNQIIPTQYLRIDPEKSLFGGQYDDPLYHHYPTNGYNEPGRGGRRTDLLSRFTYAHRGVYEKMTFKGVNDPVYDEWLGPVDGGPYNGYSTFIRQLVVKDFNDPTYLHTLGSFWNYELSEHALAYILDTKDTINKSTDNVFSVTAYNGEKITNQIQLKIDDDNNIHFRRDVGDRETMHLIYSICTDPSILTDNCLERLGCHPHFFFDYLFLLNPRVACEWQQRIEDELNDIEEGHDICIPKWLIEAIFKDIYVDSDSRGKSRGLVMRTVGIFDILSDKKGSM